MAVVYNPFSGELVLVPTSGGGTPSNPITVKYSSTFTNATWALSGLDYVITISANVHGIQDPTASVYELVGSDYEQVNCVVVKKTNNDILIKVSSTPDNRFNGLLIII